MEKKNIDWSNLGFGYMPTDMRFVSDYKDGKWDEGSLTADNTITMSECACVLQYAQTIFEGLKAYTTADGRIVCFRPDLNAARLADSASFRCLFSLRINLLKQLKKLLRRMPNGFLRTAQVQRFISVRLCSAQTQL